MNDPQKAATVANLWAKILVDKINELYGPQRDTQSFSQALDQAHARLNQADIKLRVYNAEHGIDLGGGTAALATDGTTLYTNQGKTKQLLMLKNSQLAAYRQA